jgi:outer membrane protein OmpA-like peptidoglycan-associated protein
MRKSNRKKQDAFWMSYSDLMTSLFFIMLVLFVFTFSNQRERMISLEKVEKERDDLLIYKEEIKRYREIEKTINNIDTNYFKYDSINKKHIMNMSFKFPTGSYDINKIVPDIRDSLQSSGEVLRNLLLHFPEEENIKYLIVVEGQASKDGWKGNDDLSFHRAQSLVNFWKKENLGMDTLKNCEIIIAGSGIKGIPREIPDTPPANQRFLITIVPKIGEMHGK